MHKTILSLLFLLGSQFTYAQEIEETLADVFNEYSLMGLSVWVSADDSDEAFHYGFKDYGRNLFIDDNTKFRIASISKSVTALGLLKLYDDGLFELDDDISDALGYTVRNPQFPSIPITYRMVLSHQSSLQDGTGYNNFLSATFNNNPLPNISELLLPSGSYYTSNMWRTESPGSYFTYSNINFGLLGALIEKHSGERFDVYMRAEILEPLGMSGSFNIQDLPDLNDLAVLYRNVGGWQAQIDNYEGVYPTPPDLNGYIPGTNGVYFAPQGGLRISAKELGLFTSFLLNNGANSDLSISPTTISEMKNIAWDYNGSNGDNYFGLFNRWGLGLQHANATSGDQICNLGSYDSFLGHPGEAYGLVSDAFFEANQDLQFAMLINGNFNGYQFGDNSSFYKVEEAVFAALCTYFENQLSIADFTPLEVTISPNPASHHIDVKIAPIEEEVSYHIYDLKGSIVLSSETVTDTSFNIDVENLDSGLYFLYISTSTSRTHRKIIIE